MDAQERAERMRITAYQRELTDRLGRGQDHWARALGKPNAGWADFIGTTFKRALRAYDGGDYLPRHAIERAFSGKVKGTPVQALVVHNRWIANCECMGAEAVDPDQPVFYCFSCFNQANKGYPRPVSFPAEIADIEEILTQRVDPFTKNWIPSETLNDLEAQNVAHGFPPRREKIVSGSKR